MKSGILSIKARSISRSTSNAECWSPRAGDSTLDALRANHGIWNETAKIAKVARPEIPTEFDRSNITPVGMKLRAAIPE